MGLHNSLVVFYTTLVKSVYSDIAVCYGLSTTEYQRELSILDARCAREGISFLTKTLPSFAKAIDLALGTNTNLQTRAFNKRKGSALPKFLGWLLRRVFDEDGMPLRRGDPMALKHIRQLLYLLYKLEIPHGPELEKRVLDTFVEVDGDIAFSGNALSTTTSKVLDKARQLCCQVFQGFDHREITPSHGPGSVATGEKAHEKLNFSRLYADIERVYPFTEYFMYSMSHVVDEPDYLGSLETLGAGTAKVVLVPKDSRGPRVISCEPLEFQWIQQGLSRAIVNRLQSHRLTKGHVNFTDQEINRRLALQGSKTGEWITLDMKEASDRVSLELVKELFSGTTLLDALLATRSTFTRLPDGRLIEMKKFAPMGSALCFPVESLCFFVLCVAVLEIYGKRPRAYALDNVFVYGDDIICRREDYALILQYLPEFGLLFNKGKCCTSGSFRESCGMDAFAGVDVTPTKCRTTWCRRTLGAERLSSWVSYCNSLYAKGYYIAAEWLEAQILKKEKVPYSKTSRSSYIAFVRPITCVRESMRQCGIRVRYNADLQRLEAYTVSVSPRYIRGETTDWRTMLSRMRSTRTEVGVYAVPHRSNLKRGWHPI